MFDSRISAGAPEKLPGWDKPHAKTVAWSYDMEGHAKKCVERSCELAIGATRGLSSAYEPRISLRERPAECSYMNPKRRISEIMSDHSLSS